MSAPLLRPQITVLDTGGQYTHLITRRVRELGVYADILPAATSPAELAGRRGVIISGGPASVFEAASPQVVPELFAAGIPVLGICYGLQLMAFHLGGRVTPGVKGEYGQARIDFNGTASAITKGLDEHEQIWMSHRDVVSEVPPHFTLLGSTETCTIAAIADEARALYGVQFHPEVVHTPHGQRVLSNFLFDICHCEKDWNPAGRIAAIEDQIRETAQGRNILFFVSGGVDSTVAYTLCLRALGDDRVRGYYVDTGLMRQDETAFVQHLFRSLGSTHFEAVHAEDEFLSRLANAVEPETKRKIIGEQFVAVQDRLLNDNGLMSDEWLLGQGTIYPDTIESGGTAHADLIKTHHNRVAGIQALIAAGRVIEPLALFYKDEVREIGEQLGLPHEFLHRHPFPGPGLAIRCLGAESAEVPVKHEAGYILPVRSVGVQGDSRSYRPVLAIHTVDHARATALINQFHEVNRVVAILSSKAPIDAMSTHATAITAERLDRLRRADKIVRDFTQARGIDAQVWQFPVILIPFGTADTPDSLVLRPITSVDGMTAQSALIPHLDELTSLVANVDGLAAIFYDLTHKPPGTIEWE